MLLRDGRGPAALLALLCLGACLIGDALGGSLALTPPLLVAALVAAGVAAWGVPRLRQLRMGQVIRDDGPQAHLSKAGTPTKIGRAHV